jgi:selenocysteine lyase/cysteine desulfurase
MLSFFRTKKKTRARVGQNAVGVSGHDPFAHIRHGIIGNGAVIDGPFGARKLFYADYVASGRSYGPIEDKIRQDVLPLYANTHTESSMTGRQTTAYREQARQIIAKNIGAGDQDAVIFCGSGCTGAVDKFIRVLRLKLPHGMTKYGICTQIKPEDRPVVFIGPFEHHSNDVQWRETIADVVTIEETADGLIDLNDLKTQLDKYKDRPLKVGSFSAASNVTGILVDTAAVAKLLHRYDALACFDYAAAAPYLKVDMNRPDGAYMDAVFISTHKYLGGPGTPGILALKKKWAQNKTPVVPGGGTVSYVSPCAQAYLDNIEHREEGGTPDIVGAIRAGLAFKLQEDIGAKNIMVHELDFAKKAMKRWSAHENIQVLGSREAERLPIFSFLIKCGKYYLHYNYVVALLNDLFGIQARGGCSCAGPYGHRLLDIDLQTSQEYADIISDGVEVLKPGWVRVGFNYFYSDEEAEQLLRGVEWIADHGHKLLPAYNFETATGLWTHKDGHKIAVRCLMDVHSDKVEMVPNNMDALVKLADQYVHVLGKHTTGSCCEILKSTPDHLRWFSLAEDAA